MKDQLTKTENGYIAESIMCIEEVKFYKSTDGTPHFDLKFSNEINSHLSSITVNEFDPKQKIRKFKVVTTIEII